MPVIAFKDGAFKTKDKKTIKLLNNTPASKEYIPYPLEVTWIKNHKEILNLKSVAEAIGMPVKNLWNYCNDIHSLNEKWWAAAVKWVKSLKVG